MSRKEYRRYSQIEHIDTPDQSMDGWKEFEQFEYRVSWRIYRKEDGKEYRDYRVCAEIDLPTLLPTIEEWFGPRGPNGRWEFYYDYMYLFFRTLEDVTEFKLRIDLPG